ncbi:hypothetical protein CHARACLAT_018676 [Characodon lateralis]|uniref:Uncharacterized protein n=1 Tax=Characodon lateralis TaxID=208331 RepID=A0ABU7CZE5_9TELE|nr:hypothetical protein [Characodon lateralis]
MALWSKSSPASFCLSRYAPPLRPPVRHAGHGNKTFPLGGFIISVTSELRRLLSCACSNVRPKWMTPTSAACCCWPLGMAALHYSKKVKAANAAGDIEAAEDASTTAKILNIISFISGLIILSFVIFFEVTMQ